MLDGALRPIFTAANYPPLYFRLAGLGDPFVVGRAVSIAATLAVAAAIAWRARRAGRLASFALAAAWLATVPVIVWGPAVKPDLVALALTVAGAVLLGRGVIAPFAAGVLLALAWWAKPTAALPAVALLAWCVTQGPRATVAYAAGGAAGLAVASVVLMGPGFPIRDGEPFWIRVVSWNALPWDPVQAVLLALVAAATVGAFAGVAAARARSAGPLGAYFAGAAAIAVLGGREGATINYLLDLSAAAALIVAAAAPALRAGALFPLAVAAQLAVGMVLLDPLGILPGRSQGTGAWGDPARIEIVRSLPAGPALVEDSGLLIAVGREPVVDDLFLWSRQVARGGSFLEGDRVLEAVRERRFTSIASEVDLERLDAAPAYERARWHPALVREVVERYALDRAASGLWIYLPR